MKILVVGDGHSAIHEVAVSSSFKQLGNEVKSFYWYNYFQSRNPIVRVWLRLQNKFLVGPVINKLNRDLIKLAVEFQPRLIFVYRGTHIMAETLTKLKQALPHCEIFGYNNDDPFAAGHPPWLWQHFIKGVPIYDVVFAYRNHNLNELRKIGVKKTELLRSWYIPESNKHTKIPEDEKGLYDCDVVFIGHFENDGRLDCLEEIVRNGYDLRLYGPPYEWNSVLLKSSVLKHLVPVRLVWDEEYNKAISGAKAALCFLSKLNRDTYTRRCFEIPAIGTLLISEYSEDMNKLFKSGEEAAFFSTPEDLIDHISFYMQNDDVRKRVSKAGHLKVTSAGYDIHSRMKKVLSLVNIEY
jgi:spore maturation protein CgeB